MWMIILVPLLLGAQFSFTAFAPAEPGKAWSLWPFASDARLWLGFVGGLTAQSLFIKSISPNEGSESSM